MKANREKWARTRKALSLSDDEGNGDAYAFMFVKPTLTEERQNRMEANIRENQANQDNLYELSRQREVQRPSYAQPTHHQVGVNMQALLNADQQKMTLAEKQIHLAKKYRAKHDIGDISRLKKAKRNSRNFGKPTEIPPVSLNKVCAPAFKLDLATFEPKETVKTEWQTKLLKKVIDDSTVLKENARATENRLIAVMEEIQLKRGEILSKQGEIDEKDDRYYVVETGVVEFEVDGEMVAKAEAGTAFGEERLLYRSANKATIKASEDTKLFRLDQQTFRGIMQQEQLKEQRQEVEHKKISQRPPVIKEKRTKTIAGEWDLSDSHIFQEQQAIRDSVKQHASDKDDLEMIRMLGEGQFGEVWLVAATHPEYQERMEFALKMQNLEDDELREDPSEAIQKEINALQAVHHPFIVNLVHVYESDTSIDMLLGLIKGDELWTEVHREEDDGMWVSGFSEARARFYSVVLLDTLAFLHKHEYLFRDFKPENVMIDEDGYPILVDFGFAKHVPKGEKTFTFCGTPNYVAPEIIKMVGHDAGVDLWAFGVVIYEMICGENPFFYDGMDQFALYQSITDEKHYDLDADKHSKEAIDLCDKLLEKDPEKRLGSNHPHDILEHDWYRGIPDLAEYRAKRVEPPPLLGGPLDFDEVIEEETESVSSVWDGEPEDLSDPSYDVEKVSIDIDENSGRDENLGKSEAKKVQKIKNIQLVQWKSGNKGALKGYYAKEKTKEQKKNSKDRRNLLKELLDDDEDF